MRLALAVLISCAFACGSRPSVGFLAQPAPRVLEIETRHRLALDLEIGFDGDVERQRWVDQGASRVRSEQQTSGVVVRWLEQVRREGEVVTPDPLEGRSVVVREGAVEPIDPRGPLAPRDEALARTWARALEPDALQVALLARPVVVEERAREAEVAFGTLARGALGPGAELDDVRLVVSAATDAVAVFDVSLAARTTNGATSMRCDLAGTLTVARRGALPLSLSLEGPATFSAPQVGNAPAMQGNGTMHLERRLRLVDTESSTVAER
jgi:hypothetical protein